MVKIKDLINEIIDVKDLDSLKEIGKKLYEMEESYEKRMVLTLFKEKKNAILNEKKGEDSIFADLYWIIVAPDKSFSRIGRLLYRLKDSNLLSKAELNALFEIYEKKKQRLEVNTNGEENDNDNV